MRFALTRPILGLDDKPVSTLNVRDYMTIGDSLAALRESAAEPAQHDLVLVSKLCGMPASLLEQLEVNDYERLVAHAVTLKKTSTSPASPQQSAPALASGDPQK